MLLFQDFSLIKGIIYFLNLLLNILYGMKVPTQKRKFIFLLLVEIMNLIKVDVLILGLCKIC